MKSRTKRNYYSYSITCAILLVIICIWNTNSYANSFENIIKEVVVRISNEMLRAVKKTINEHPVKEQPAPSPAEVSVPTTEPYLKFNALYTDIGLARIGDTVTVKGEYTAVNGGIPPRGTISLFFGGQQLGKPANLEFSQEGQVQFEKKLTMRKGLKEGKYEVLILIEYCGKNTSMKCAFSISK